MPSAHSAVNVAALAVMQSAAGRREIVLKHRVEMPIDYEADMHNDAL
jgi:hypothetical protein